MQDGTVINKGNNLADLSPREMIFKYLKYLPWIIVFVSIMMALAYLKLRYSTPIYNVSGKMLVKRHSQYEGSNEKFNDIFMMQSGSTNLNDEMELIKSKAMASRVVVALGLQKQLYNKGNVRTTLIHSNDFPFTVDFRNIKDSTKVLSYVITILNNNEFQINEVPKTYNFREPVRFPECELYVQANPSVNQKYSNSNIYIVSWSPLEEAANNISNSISVAQINTAANVLRLDYQTENTKMGLDIVNQFMLEYQKSGLEDKKQTAVNTLSFIEDQLDTVRRDLGVVELDMLDFRKKNNIFAPEEQSQLFFEEFSSTRKDLTQFEVKLKVIDYLSNYLKDQKNLYKMVPTTLGIEEPILGQQIAEFNKYQTERQVALKTTTENNQLIKDFETPIAKLRQDIAQNLENIRQTYLLSLKDLKTQNSIAGSEISSIPIKEKQLLDVKRKQSILGELYSYLLQKKLETSIASASTISNVKILEEAEASITPVSPQKRSIYTIAIFIGCLIPISILFLREYLNDKVQTKADITKVTAAPIIGDVGHSDDNIALVVKADSRNLVAEQFRIIRTNMEYLIHKTEKSVIMVTSSFSGEGKSFISTNIGAVIALAGKRAVILEFDLRKPKIMSGLNLSPGKGITNFIVGNASVEELITPVPSVNNLFVVPCGPIPPNPSELLLDDKITELFTYLRKNFDVVLIDTAPIGLVSDAIILGKFADATLYIMRQNYTFKKQLVLIEELYANKKLPSLSLILNDITMNGKYGNYGYGYGYSYGYGYGSEVGYFEGQNKKKKGFFQRIKNFFSW